MRSSNLPELFAEGLKALKNVRQSKQSQDKNSLLLGRVLSKNSSELSGDVLRSRLR
jgi:hypothetical protein